MNEDMKVINELKVGFVSSLSFTLLTIIGFGFAMIAIPPAGPYCPGNCMEYPFVDILKYYPRDYIWMYIISFQLIAFLVFVIAKHFNAPKDKKIFSFIGVALAIMTVTVLLANYFVQYSVIPISMIKGQTEGIPLLTQYNGHGIFIVLEDLGFILMSLVFLALYPIYKGQNRIEKALKLSLIVPAVLVFLSFVYYAMAFGLDRDYRFEVAAITIDWFLSIVIGILSSIYFYRLVKEHGLNSQQA